MLHKPACQTTSHTLPECLCEVELVVDLPDLEGVLLGARAVAPLQRLPLRRVRPLQRQHNQPRQAALSVGCVQ